MSEHPTGSPVSLAARIDQPRRWSWLYKWILVIPHLFVLAFMWAAFVVLTLIAFVAIVFTGRYPRWAFDFNVGVLRWSWRVQLYAFSLSTDRYPPFSIGAEPEYPSSLEVAYPEHLSRGLVWVKSWLLAIPHLIIVAALVGGVQVSVGLSGILALVAGLTLAVKQEYPASVFDLLVGIYRWAFRVVAYVALMTDEYPPFRLDQGPDEPPAPVVASASAVPPTAPAAA
jgi:Domain of unknown function (DUF4389)